MDEEDDLEQQDTGAPPPIPFGQEEDDDNLVTGASNQMFDMPPPIPFGSEDSDMSDMPPPIPFGSEVEPESALGSAARGAMHSAIPAIGSLPAMGAGAAGGAALGAPLGPVGAAVGGIAGGVAGAMGAGALISAAQEKVLDTLGINDKEQRAANEREHPIASFAGELAPNLAAFKPGKLADSLVQRVLGGGLMGGLEAGQELGTEGHLDPTKVALAAGFGAAFSSPTKFGERAMGMGGRFVAGRVPGQDVEAPTGDPIEDRRAANSSENVKTGVGNAQEQAPPNRNVTGVGNEASAPERSERTYEKRRSRLLAAQEEQSVADPGVTHLQDGEVPADIRGALESDKPSRQVMPEGEQPTSEKTGFDWVRGEAEPMAPIDHGEEGLSSGEPTPEPAAVPQGNVGQPRRPQEPFVDRGAAPDPRLAAGVARLRGRDPRVLEDLRGPENSQPATPAVRSNGQEAQPVRPQVNAAVPSQVDAAPRQSRVLQDLSQQAPEKTRAQLMKESNEARIRELTGKAPEAPEELTTRAQEDAAPVETTPAEKTSGSYPIKDYRGNVVSYAKSEQFARRRSNELKAAADTMDAFKERFDKDVNINKGDQVEALRALASEALTHAKELGWNRFVPRKVKDGVAHEALWMDEVRAFAEKRKRDGRQYQPADFLARERLLRSGDAEAVQQVREDRFDQGDRAMKRSKAFTKEVTDSGNFGDKVKGFLSDESGAGKPMFGGEVQQVRDQGDEIIKQAKAPWGVKLRDMDKLAQGSDQLFGGPDRNPLRTVHSMVERARVKSLKYFHEDEDLHKRMWELKAADPDGFSELERLMQDESYYQRNGELPIDKQGFNTNGPEKAYRDSKHADLEQRWNDLPEEMKDLRAELYDYAEKRHEAISDTLAANRLEKLLGVDDPALAKRVMEDTHDAADFQRLGKDDLERQSRLELLQEIASRERVVGPYTPMIRRGKYAVTGLYKMVDTGNELPNKTLDENTREFASKADAEDFAEQQHSTTKVRRVYVDKNTGETGSKVTEAVTDKKGRQAQDPAGRDLEHEKSVPFTKEDMQVNPDIEERYRATVERGYLKMTDTNAEATAHAKDLDTTGDFDKVDRQPRRYRPHTDAVALASNFTNLENKLHHNVVYQSMDAKGQTAVKELLAEHYLQSLTSTRSTNTKLHRNYVRGADEDLMKNMLDYSAETGSRLARLEHQPALDSAVETARGMVNEDPKFSSGRQRVLNEFESRLDAMKDDFFSLASGQMGPGMHRAMSWSYTSKLATPSFTVRNLTQLPLMAGSEIGGKHGFGATFREMGKVYKEIGTGKTLWGGAKDTAKAAVGKLDKPTGFVEDVTSRLSEPREKKLMGHLVDEGVLDPDAGFQIAEFVKRGEPNFDWNFGRGGAENKNALMTGIEKGLGKTDAALHWVEQVSRQLPRAAETINRAGSGLIAYRLEYKKLLKDGLSEADADAKATRYATDVVKNTQFIYTDTNKPTWQRNQWLRPAFQFKQFGKSTYEFIGRHAATSIDSLATPEERSAARRSLGGMFVGHVIVAGALGLPWEPVRALLIGAKAAGITSKEWDDVENGIREGLTGFGNLAGLNEKNSKKVAEVLSRGLPRLAGIDLSPGLGIDNMLLFGSPRSGQDREMDTNLAAWMYQMAAGAPGGLAIQMLHGMRDIMGGNYAEGVEKLSPMKIGSDVMKAEEGYRHGKQNVRGRETMAPYSAAEAGAKAFGFPLAREAEQNTYAHQVYQQGQEIKDTKSKAISDWLKADQSEKGATFKRAIDAGIKPSDLTAAAQRLQSEKKRSVNGVAVNRDTRPIAERLRRVYVTE